MKFCPKCDLRLKKSSGSSTLSCPKCDYTEGQKSEIQHKVSQEEPKSDFLVLDENEGKETMRFSRIDHVKMRKNMEK